MGIDYKSRVSREKVAVLYDKIRACGANKGVLILSSNFQSGAVQFASKHGVALIQLTDFDSLYETRSGFNGQNNLLAISQKKINSYVGVMQTGEEHKVSCSYFSNTKLILKEFLYDKII